MSDLDVIEEIGENLEKKNEEKAAPTEELRSAEVEVVADDVIEEIDEEMRDRINKLIANGEFIQFTAKDLDLIILPEPDEDGTVPLGKYQFRRIRDNYDELKDDIRLKGITKYLILKREVDEYGFASYEILDGNTRRQILVELLAEDPEFPIPTFIVLDCSDADATLIAKNYNEFSENLDSEDDQYAVIRSIEVGGISQVEGARRYGYSESYVSDIVAAFQKVPEEVREMIETRQLTVKHGTELARLQDYPKKQKSLANKTLKQKEQGKDWNTVWLRKNVTKELLKIGYLDDGAGVIDEVAEKYITVDLELKQKTKSQVDQIHADLQKKFGKPKNSWSDDVIFNDCTGDISIGPTKAATERILKKAGYKIVDDPEPTKSKKDEEQKGEAPQIALMPSDDELMDDVSGGSICVFCGGSAHPIVSEKLGFGAGHGYVREKQTYGNYHAHCELQSEIRRNQNRIDQLNKEIVNLEKKFQKEKISVLMKKKKLTLEQINEEATSIYAEAVKKKKAEWYQANIPLDKLKESNPDLVPEHYWEPIEMFLRREEGYDSLKTAGSQVGEDGVTNQSFSNQLKKVRQALATVE